MYNIIKQDKIMLNDSDTSYQNLEHKKLLFKTIGELYIVYIQSKKFLSEDTTLLKLLDTTLLKNNSIMEESFKNIHKYFKNSHEMLEEIFEDLTRLDTYICEDEIGGFLDLTQAYYRVSTLDLILKYVKDDKWKQYEDLILEDEENGGLKRVVQTIINDEGGNYNSLLADCMQHQIDRIQNLETTDDYKDYKIIITSESQEIHLTSESLLSSYLEENYLDYHHSENTNSYFIDALESLGINKENAITQTLSRNLDNEKFKEIYIAIGEALFNKDNNKVKDMVDNYLENYRAVWQVIQKNYEEKKPNNTPIYIVSAVIGLLIMGGIAILMKQNAGDVNKNNDGDTFIQEDSDI